MKSKICTKCKIEKPLEEFYTDKRGLFGKRERCRTCCINDSKTYVQKLRKTNPNHPTLEYFKNYHKKYDVEYLLNPKNYVRKMFLASQRRAKLKGLEHNISEKDINLPECCPVLAIPLNIIIGTKEKNMSAPSLDRIDSKKGYIKENIRVISHRANTLKSDASLMELIKLGEDARKILNKNVFKDI